MFIKIIWLKNYKIKYSNRNRIDLHHGAAMCIGRKGLFNKEKTIKAYSEKYQKEYDKKRK